MRSPTRQLKRVIRSTSKRRRALPGGLSRTLRHRLKSYLPSPKFQEKAPTKRLHVIFFGVGHSTRKGSDYYPNRPWLKGTPNRNLSQLKEYLTAVKANNIHRIGVEMHVPQISNKGRKSRYIRYWHVLFLVLKRRGFRAVEIENPIAIRLVLVLERLKKPHNNSLDENAQKNFRLFARYFPTVSFNRMSSDLRALEEAFHYFRSLKMRERAEKLNLQAAIVGDFHREDVADKDGFEVNPSDLKSEPERMERSRKCFERFEKPILKLYADVQKRKVRVYDPHDLSH